MIFLLLPTYPMSTSTVTSFFSGKKKSAVSKTLFFSFHLRCCKNENLWWFSPYPVNRTIIWPTTDRIPHFLVFKRMQIKWIADNIRAFAFVLTNWNKEPDKEAIYRWGEFFHKLDNKKWKMRTGARARKQNYISIYISLSMKTVFIELWKECLLKGTCDIIWYLVPKVKYRFLDFFVMG